MGLGIQDRECRFTNNLPGISVTGLGDWEINRWSEYWSCQVVKVEQQEAIGS
tara:strand:- start:452 stop:607 length:156 start_codon:yes stop_codon:yes gene_type:complete